MAKSQDDFPPVQHPSDYGSDTLFDLMYDASRRLTLEYILRLPEEHGPDHPMMLALRAVIDERDAVPLDDVAAWKAKRDDFNQRAKVLRQEREAWGDAGKRHPKTDRPEGPTG